MPFVCLDCFEIYENNIALIQTSNGHIYCPKKTCYGEIIEVDELLLPTIILLNKKNYKTAYCCAGHFLTGIDENAYIMFKNNCQPLTVPKGFTSEFNFGTHTYTIRKWFREDVESERVENILTTALELYKWAESLPQNEYYLEEEED